MTKSQATRRRNLKRRDDEISSDETTKSTVRNIDIIVVVEDVDVAVVIHAFFMFFYAVAFHAFLFYPCSMKNSMLFHAVPCSMKTIPCCFMQFHAASMKTIPCCFTQFHAVSCCRHETTDISYREKVLAGMTGAQILSKLQSCLLRSNYYNFCI
jgi:hypothetical protein